MRTIYHVLHNNNSQATLATATLQMYHNAGYFKFDHLLHCVCMQVKHCLADPYPYTKCATFCFFFVFQAKYYARSNGILFSTQRKESDKMIISTGYDNGINYSDINISTITSCLFYAVNVLLSMVCICSVPYLLQQISEWSGKNITLLKVTFKFNLLYLAVVIISLVWSIAYYFIYICSFRSIINVITNVCDIVSDGALSSMYSLLHLVCVIVDGAGIIIWMYIKKFKPASIQLCCCQLKNQFVLKGVHTIAISLIFRLVHRIVFNLVVAIPYIAVAPAQVLAFIALIYSAVIFTLLYLHYIFLITTSSGCCRRGSCGKCSKSLWLLIAALLLYTGVLIVLTLFTVYFFMLASNGLASSGLGSVLLSFTPPAIVFLLTLKFKSKAGVPENSAGNTEITGATTVDKADSPDQRNDNILSEKSPLLLINEA